MLHCVTQDLIIIYVDKCKNDCDNADGKFYEKILKLVKYTKPN